MTLSTHYGRPTSSALYCEKAFGSVSAAVVYWSPADQSFNCRRSNPNWTAAEFNRTVAEFTRTAIGFDRRATEFNRTTTAFNRIATVLQWESSPLYCRSGRRKAGETQPRRQMLMMPHSIPALMQPIPMQVRESHSKHQTLNPGVAPVFTFIPPLNAADTNAGLQTSRLVPPWSSCCRFCSSTAHL